MGLSPHIQVHLALRQLELALALPGAIEDLRDTAGSALDFVIELRRIVDAYEERCEYEKANS